MSVLDIIKKAVSRDRASSPPAQPNDGLGFGSSNSTTTVIPRTSAPVAQTPAMSVATLADKAPKPIMSVKPAPPAPAKEPGIIKKIAKSAAPDSDRKSVV